MGNSVVTKGNATVGGVIVNGVETEIVLVKNVSGGTLSPGNLVYAYGHDGTRPSVHKADADDPAKIAEYVVLDTIVSNGIGRVAREAQIMGLDTSASGAAGDPVYLSATAGAWTLTAPTGPDQVLQKVGVVVVDSTTGTIRFDCKQPPQKIGLSSMQATIPRKYTVYSTGALAIGDLLHITGYDATNDVFSVEKADADTSAKPAQLIASATNAGTTTSEARDIFELTTLNTNAGNVGDPVYLDATTAGGWTLTPPTGADQIQQIVGRIKVKSATVGKIVFNTAIREVVKLGTSGLQDDSVDKAKIASNVAGNGLEQHIDGSLRAKAADPSIDVGSSGVAIGAGQFRTEVVDGAIAGDVAVTGIAVGDELISVIRFDVATDTGTDATGNKVQAVSDLTSEFTVGAAKINNAAGTNTSGDRLLVIWLDRTA